MFCQICTRLEKKREIKKPNSHLSKQSQYLWQLPYELGLTCSLDHQNWRLSFNSFNESSSSVLFVCVSAYETFCLIVMALV